HFTLHLPRVTFRSARSRVNRLVIIFRVRRASGGLDVFARTRARINEAAGDQFIQRGSIEFVAFTLVVGCEWPAGVRALLPLEAEPFQVLDHPADELRFATGAVEVFVPQNQSAAMGACAFLRRPECARVSQVQVTCRRRSEATAVA